MKREKVYQAVILGFLLFFISSNNNFNNLLAVNNELTGLVEEQRIKNEETTKQWEQKFNNLQFEYDELLKKNYRLEARLEETDIPVYRFTEAEIELIALCVEAEAGYYKNAPKGQEYVTQVILNRLHSSSFPDSIDEVIYQKTGGVPQFSVAHNGMMNNREIQLETLLNVYRTILHGTDLPEYVTYFCSSNVAEKISSNLEFYTVADGTAFAYDRRNKYE